MGHGLFILRHLFRTTVAFDYNEPSSLQANDSPFRFCFFLAKGESATHTKTLKAEPQLQIQLTQLVIYSHPAVLVNDC